MSYVFPLIAAFIWGANTIVTKLASGLISPGEISFLRWFIATLVLTPFALKPLIKNAEAVRNNLLKFLILGVLGGVIFQCLAYYAAGFTSAMDMGIIQALMPLIAILLASILFRTFPSIWTVFGAFISLLGVTIVLSGGHIDILYTHGLNTGDMLMLIGVLAMAVYNTLLKRWHINVPLIVSLYLQAIAAAIVLLPIYLFSQKHMLNLETSGLIIYSAIGSSILAPMTWMAGAKTLGPSRVSLFFNLIPVFTAILAVSFLSEKFSLPMLIGGLLVLGGVIFVEVTIKSAPPHSESQT